ncbi:MAG TPA: isochorismatase family cysteine hydrolase [Fodinibius sp.]|nr:isochorismatase family cysteine hydrolase [Fodinibius sp.]
MKALLIIDMLNDFVTGTLACERAQRIIPNIHALAGAFRAADLPVIYNNDAHLPEVDAEFDIWGPHALQGTEGARVIPELEPEQGDIIIPKRRYSGFTGTDLHLQLQELGVDTIVLTGLHTNMCLRHTSYDAFLHGYGIEVPEDGADAFEAEQHQRGLAYIEKMYAGVITSSQELIPQANASA